MTHLGAANRIARAVHRSQGERLQRRQREGHAGHALAEVHVVGLDLVPELVKDHQVIAARIDRD